MQWVYAVLSGVRLLGKTPIRQTYSRRPSLLQVSRQRPFSTSSLLYREVDGLARKILRMKIEELNEFESICQRIGLGSKITIQKFILSEESKERTEDENEEYITSVSLDGVNIGLLSDGTLRVLSLLIELIASHPSVTTIIEEPETQIHPGMLAKLLNEIETYTFGENLILSTHSPQVVAWTSPDKINLVYRDHGQTIVRKLHEEEIQKVVEYLCEEGDLGDWLYSGILDE
jgi:predicted ATP-dependent endonuclease of OLD family